MPVASATALANAAAAPATGRLADPLGPVRAGGVRVLDRHRLGRQPVLDRRQRVVGEVRVDDPAVAEQHLLQVGEPEAEQRPALDLPLEAERVDHLPDVVAGEVPQHLHRTGVRVDPHVDEVRAVVVGDVDAALVRRVVERRRRAPSRRRGASAGTRSSTRRSPRRDRGMRAFASTVSTAKPSRRSTSGSSTLNILAAMPTSDFRTSVGGHLHRLAADRGVAGGDRGARVVHAVRVDAAHGHPRQRDAQDLGDDLGAHGARALAHVGQAHADQGAAVLRDLDAGARRRRRPRRRSRCPAAGTPPRGRSGTARRSRAAAGARRGALRRRRWSARCPRTPGRSARSRWRRRPSSAFFRLRARGSMPSFRASSSMFDSEAKVACGTPKPRQAPQ